MLLDSLKMGEHKVFKTPQTASTGFGVDVSICLFSLAVFLLSRTPQQPIAACLLDATKVGCCFIKPGPENLQDYSRDIKQAADAKAVEAMEATRRGEPIPWLLPVMPASLRANLQTKCALFLVSLWLDCLCVCHPPASTACSIPNLSSWPAL